MRATRPGQPAHLLLDIVECLNGLRIPYVVIGAFAVSFHGVPRATNDSDAVIWLHGTDITEAALAQRISDAGFRAQVKLGDAEDPLLGVITVQDDFGNMLDLILGIRGLDPAASQRAVDTFLLDTPIRIAGIEDLIAMKLFAGGTQDREDVRGILQVAGDNLNVGLARNLTGRYGVSTQQALEVILASLLPKK